MSNLSESNIKYTKSLPQDVLIKQIENYYQLKAGYEREKEKIKNKILGTNKSNKDKKRDYAETIPKCVNCNRAVGMIFEQQSNTLIAQCGAVSGQYKNKKGEPVKECDLNIIITTPDYYDIEDIINEYGTILSKLKKDLKILKLRHLYDYIDDDESLAEYNELIKEYEAYVDVFSALKTKQLEQQNNDDEERLLLKNNQAQLMNTIIDGFKEAEENSDIAREIKKKVFEYYKTLSSMNDEIRNKEYYKTFFEPSDIGLGSSTYQMKNNVIENEIII
jgi:hypothetical protein